MRDADWLLEHENLSIAGTPSDSWLAFRRYEEGDRRGGSRLPFQRDRDRIIHCEAFRCLMHKTQVFPSPLLAQFRTRLTHTIEVAQIARAISRTLGLNEDLAEAIALGHDLGHAPFGHVGEDALRALLRQTGDRQCFEHNEHSLIIVDTAEDCDTVEGRRPGMNLTKATRQGILCHARYTERDYGDRPKSLELEWEQDLGYSSKEQRDRNEPPFELPTAEAQVVDISDEIAYLTHDLEDCRRAEILQVTEAPAELQRFMAGPRNDALHSLILSVTAESDQVIREAESRAGGVPQVQIRYDPEITQLVSQLQHFFREHIFKKEALALRNREAEHYLTRLFEHWIHRPPPNVNAAPVEIARFIARKTDQEIISDYEALFKPQLHPKPQFHP